MSEETQEFIDEDVEKKQKRKPTVFEMLQFELRTHMSVALDLKKKIDEAKTSCKKEYYGKKLRKNNVEAMKVLTAIERVSAGNKVKQDEPIAEEE